MTHKSSLVKFCCVTYKDIILVSHQTEQEDYLNLIGTFLQFLDEVPGEKKLTFPFRNFQVYVLAEENGLIYSCITDPSEKHLLPYIFLDVARTKLKEIPGLLEKALSAEENVLEADFAPILAAIVFDFNESQCKKLTALEVEVHDVKRIVLDNVEKLIETGKDLEDLITKIEDARETNGVLVSRRICKHWRMWFMIIGTLFPILVIAVLIAYGRIRL